MKRFARGLLFLPLLSLALFSPFSLASGKTYRGQVVKVFDGDTLLVRINGHKEFIRLREIDAPEMASRKQQGQEPWGKRAREFALSRLKDRKVRVETEDRDERDAYHRLLAYIFVGESLLNREMVESGNAFFYRVQSGAGMLPCWSMPRKWPGFVGWECGTGKMGSKSIPRISGPATAKMMAFFHPPPGAKAESPVPFKKTRCPRTRS
jgi:endonuclease YncB( thermonuclease family)